MLWVAGERLTSDRGPDMAALLQDAGLGERLRLLGYRDDVPDLMAAADIFVLPSRFEGLPMSVIEAMLTGLPVVATNVRGPARAGGAGGDRPAGAAGRRIGACRGLGAAWWPIRRCGRRWARRAASARWSVTTKRRCWRERWTCWGCRSIPPRMIDIVPIRRALISVSDKAGLVPFAQALAASGVEILSTGGSAKALREAGVPVKEVSEHSGFPEILDGRVKTLVPQIHGGILGRRDNAEHVAQMAAHGIAPIDLVAVNLYPFEATVAQGAPDDACIENIDIGGPALIRAAAKNHDFVTVLTEPGPVHGGAG